MTVVPPVVSDLSQPLSQPSESSQPSNPSVQNLDVTPHPERPQEITVRARPAVAEPPRREAPKSQPCSRLRKIVSHLPSGGIRPFALILMACAWLTSSLATAAGETTALDYAVQLTATVDRQPPQIHLSWVEDSGTVPIAYAISRRFVGDVGWTPLATLSGTTTDYLDIDVAIGIPYEYRVIKSTAEHSGYGYIVAGMELSLVETRGKIILIVDNTYAADLADELARLQQDLSGDGWIVLRHDVARTDSVTAVKSLILADVAEDPEGCQAVLLFGHVPVPYSGSVAMDGHPEHEGAWPADVYYGDVTGSWTDSFVTKTSADDPRNHNSIGDGKFDQAVIPGWIQLAVGRVDMANLPAFGLSETELLRRYLTKDHQFRHNRLAVNRSALIRDEFGAFGGEAFSSSAWRGFAPMFGPANLSTAPAGAFFSTLSAESHLWAYGAGGGGYSSISGVGITADLAQNDPAAVFISVFGSYLGDWDSSNNIMRAFLATPTYTLASAWVGRPNWVFHPMAMGATIGECARITQNNPGPDGYGPASSGTRFTHIALLGDPTLRLHPVTPPSALIATPVPHSVLLRWSPPPQPVVGYHVYRSIDPAGPFTRLNPSLLTALTFTDPSIAEDQYTYQVRAVVLESSASGSYYNSSQGLFVTAGNLLEATAPLPFPVVSVKQSGFPGLRSLSGIASVTVGRTGDLSEPLTVHLSFSGNVVNGQHYLSIPSSLTLPANAAEISFAVIPFLGRGGSVIVTVQADSAYDVGTPNSVQVAVGSPATEVVRRR